jgi:hypothetical protein
MSETEDEPVNAETPEGPIADLLRQRDAALASAESAWVSAANLAASADAAEQRAASLQVAIAALTSQENPA